MSIHIYGDSTGPAGDLSLAEEFPLPPPPEELLFNNNAGPPVPPKPSLKPKPATLPTPTAPLRKKHVPDPIYAQVGEMQVLGFSLSHVWVVKRQLSLT